MKKVIKVKLFTRDSDVCDFLTERAQKYNLNVVMHWMIPYDNGFGDKGVKLFYQDYEEEK